MLQYLRENFPELSYYPSYFSQGLEFYQISYHRIYCFSEHFSYKQLGQTHLKIRSNSLLSPFFSCFYSLLHHKSYILTIENSLYVLFHLLLFVTVFIVLFEPILLVIFHELFSQPQLFLVVRTPNDLFFHVYCIAHKILCFAIAGSFQSLKK